MVFKISHDKLIPQRVFQSFETDHSTVISDLVYDYYSKRIATCAPGEVKIWDYEDEEW